MDRYWLLTWTTYGTWLPGDTRGFVSDLRDADNKKYRLNEPRSDCAADLPGMEVYALGKLHGEPVLLSSAHADVLLNQFHETVRYRGWMLLAAAIMENHVHLVVAVPGDPEPEKLLQSFKAYGSRALNQKFDTPTSDTWWTASGSTRKLPNESAVCGAIEYVRHQRNPLLVWVHKGEASGGRWSARLCNITTQPAD
jgi:REP element-mobilizing transposase RayT